jgi:hypothetical protein
METMSEPTVEALCELGQEQLMETRYLEAEVTLVRAEEMARASNDWDRLSRLYMPLQEARRQRRQRCGEGIVCLDLLAEGSGDVIDRRHVLENYPHGQLLVAGWGTLEPARAVRAMAAERAIYLETFLAAVYPVNGSRMIVVAPFENSSLPPVGAQSIEELTKNLPEGCLVLPESELPHEPMKGTPQTYGRVMALWERLHAPFLAAADAERDLLRKVELYRRTIAVDYACELAHQKLSAVARELARR